MNENIDQKDRIDNPIIENNLGLADYREGKFRLTISLQTADSKNEPVHDLVRAKLNEVPLSYEELLYSLPMLWESLTQESIRLTELLETDIEDEESDAARYLRWQRSTVNRLSLVFEDFDFTVSSFLSLGDISEEVLESPVQ